MISWNGISIRRTDRVALVGKTDSGKTTFGRVFLADEPYVLVHDSKRTVDWPGYQICRSWRDLDWYLRHPRHAPRLVWRPSALDLQNRDLQDMFFRAAFERAHPRGPSLLYVDELQSLTLRGQAPPYYSVCHQQGRERGLGVWSCTQRPTRIPLVSISEAEHCAIFFLRLANDRKRMEEDWGVPRNAQMDLQEHEFFYATERGREPYGPMKLPPELVRV